MLGVLTLTFIIEPYFIMLVWLFMLKRSLPWSKKEIASLEQFLGKCIGITPEVVFIGDSKVIQELIVQKQEIASGMLTAQFQ